MKTFILFILIFFLDKIKALEIMEYYLTIEEKKNDASFLFQA